MTPEQRITERMKQARLAAGLTQEEAAHRLGISSRTYARWEREETHGFVGHIEELAKALDTTPAAILAGEALYSPLITVEQLSAKLDEVLAQLARVKAVLV